MTFAANGQAASGQSSTGRLYTPQMLSLATRLAEYPPITGGALQGSARSDTCGGTLRIDLEFEDGCVGAVGMLVRACAVGQASAALFAQWCSGHSAADVMRSAGSVERWLAGEDAVPSRLDLSPIAEARAYPARHGAILLPWRAFADALQDAEPGARPGSA